MEKNITDRWITLSENRQEEIRFAEEPKNETDDKKCFEKALKLEINTDILEDAIRNIKTELEVLFDSESQSKVLNVIEFLKKNAYERLKNALHTLECVKEDIKKCFKSWN